MRRNMNAYLVTLALSSSLASAAVFRVAQQAPNAADANPGTEAAPWKTIGKASAVVKPGDTVWIHQGVYPEAVSVPAKGTAEAPVRIAAFGDDEVVLEGADAFPAARWTPVAGFTNIFSAPLDGDPGQIFVDGKPVYMKVEKLKWDEWKLGVLSDTDTNLWQFDAAGKRILLNLGGGNPADKHHIEVPVRTCAFSLGERCRLSGMHVRRYASTGIYIGGDDTVVEDCLVTDCVGGICASGWNRRGCLIRRNTVIGCLGNGIFLQDRPTGCRVEDNLVIRCTLNPWHAVLWSGSVKMNSAEDSVFAHNVVLEAGNRATVNGWDGWALWGDINITRVMYVGNATAHNKEAGIYIEYGMGDTRAYFNTSYKDGHGITCRQSQRGSFMRNYVESPRGSGLAIWGGGEPYPTADNVFAHNLVRNANPPLRFQIEHPNFSDYNTCWPSTNAPLADGETGRVFKTLADLQTRTGHELHGTVKDASPADAGLALTTFRVADAADPAEVLTMVGNSGCEFEDPVGVNLLPYFWRAGTGDGVEHIFLYSAYTALPGGVDTFGYSGGGGTIALRADTNVVHSGYRCLEINGIDTNRIPAEGLGFWSPTLPARPGDTMQISFWVRGRDLKPTAGNALKAGVQFSSATGQRCRRIDLPVTAPQAAGTSEWTRVEATVQVPDTARRAACFFGLRPGTGTLWLDDFAITVK
jgi:hypothetical protein